MFGYRSFKPSNCILLALIPWCPIIAVPLPENYVICQCFQGVLFRFFFQIARIFLIILRCSWVNLSVNVYVKILLLALIEKFSRTCDFCLILNCWQTSTGSRISSDVKSTWQQPPPPLSGLIIQQRKNIWLERSTFEIHHFFLHAAKATIYGGAQWCFF